MKKIIVLAFVAMLFSGRAMAVEDAESYFGFSLNYSYHDVYTDVPLIKSAWGHSDKCLAHGFNMGFTYQQALYRWLVMVTGFQYQYAMASDDVNDFAGFGLPGKGEMSFYNHNLIIPVKLGFSLTFGGIGSLSLYGGPSLNFLVSTQTDYYYNGNYRSNTDLVNGVNISRINGDKTTTRSSEYKNMGWFDIPVGIGLMATYDRFGIRFEYEWGMIDRWKGGGKFKSDQLTAGLIILLW